MTKEEILKAFLADDFFIHNTYLKKGEVDKFKWGSKPGNKLITVIELAIEGEVSNESDNIIEKKINQLLNQQ